jgi:hypothetical protein
MPRRIVLKALKEGLASFSGMPQCRMFHSL